MEKRVVMAEWLVCLVLYQIEKVIEYNMNGQDQLINYTKKVALLGTVASIEQYPRSLGSNKSIKSSQNH